MKYDIVLAIAGSDSGGGAGIQADIKAISACGCYAATAITAVTVQNTMGVEAVEAISSAVLGAQIDCVMRDLDVNAVKIGMLHSSETVLEVRRQLETHSARNIVLDPVMVSTSGHRLIEESAIATLQESLIPMADVITPNIPEAEILLGGTIESQSHMNDAVVALAERYGVSVLLKAGHLHEDNLIDYIYDASQRTITPLASHRVATRNTHGTGCTLSSALAAMLAHGMPLTLAAEKAKEYIANAIIAGADYEIGHGHGPVHHFHNFWK